MRLRLVRRGEFTMGCNGVLANKNEKPAHRVFLTSDFYLGETEVTQGQYESCVGNNPVANEKSPWVDPQNPVVFVSFEDAKHFCDKLNEHIKFPPHAVHLPTEAQWEYAARAGVDNADQASDPAVLKRRAWFSGNALKHIHQVASLQKNRWGFYDMQGNVAEWVEDAYDACFYSKKTSGQDPVAPWVNSGARVVRGGAWISPAEECRTTDRNSMTPTSRERHIGFRVVIDVHPTHFDCGTQPDHPSGRK
jgi:formylglycine-generating enzyme required for sulfatase activity